MRLRHFSPRTGQAYLGWMRRYHEFNGRRNPAELGPEHVTAFLNALATRWHVAASTQNQALAALLFLYREVLGIKLPWLDDLIHAKTPARLPVVLTRDEVRAVLSKMERDRRSFEASTRTPRKPPEQRAIERRPSGIESTRQPRGLTAAPT